MKVTSIDTPDVRGGNKQLYLRIRAQDGNIDVAWLFRADRDDPAPEVVAYSELGAREATFLPGERSYQPPPAVVWQTVSKAVENADLANK